MPCFLSLTAPSLVQVGESSPSVQKDIPSYACDNSVYGHEYAFNDKMIRCVNIPYKQPSDSPF